jgi:hypothetical protein
VPGEPPIDASGEAAHAAIRQPRAFFGHQHQAGAQPPGGVFGRAGIGQAKPDLGIEIIEDLLRPLPAHGGFRIGEALHGEHKPRIGAPGLVQGIDKQGISHIAELIYTDGNWRGGVHVVIGIAAP